VAATHLAAGALEGGGGYAEGLGGAVEGEVRQALRRFDSIFATGCVLKINFDIQH
jgi:hypothetical protein